MSLTWDLTEIDGYEARCWYEAPGDVPMRGIKKGDRILRPQTHALIMISLCVGLPRITEKNWATFYARAHAVERLTGAYLTDGSGEPILLTIADVRQHIGLRTNVTRETDAQWRKRMVQGVVDDFQRSAVREASRASNGAAL